MRMHIAYYTFTLLSYHLYHCEKADYVYLILKKSLYLPIILLTKSKSVYVFLCVFM